MFKAWKKIDQQGAAIKSLWLVIAVLVVANFYVVTRLANVPNTLRVYVPPSVIAGSGAKLKPNEVPSTTVYGFAFEIFSTINSWPTSGEEDYKKNISEYRNYLSPAFKRALFEDAQNREASGALMRTRIVSGIANMGYDANSVQYKGNNTWSVNLKLHLLETVDNNTTKDVFIEYPLLVKRVAMPITLNPWGLVIIGYASSPTRIKTII